MSSNNVAIVPSQGLGDGLLQMVFAQNLARQGFNVTFYQDHIAQLSSLIESLRVTPYLDGRVMIEELKSYDLVLYDQGSYFAKRILPDVEQLPAHFIIYSVTRKKIKRSPVWQRMEARYQRLAPCNSSWRHPLNHALSISEHFAWLAKKRLGFNQYNVYPTWSLPKEWRAQYYGKRVLIHPSSSNKSKNWAPQRFVELAISLEQDGWQPVFTVAPDEFPQWQSILQDRFDMPVFESILQLAHYYYESAALIGNDSGNGHLASAMGLPVLSIFNRKKLAYPWRPNWSKNIVVAPWLPKSLVGDKWSDYLPVETVYKGFNRLQQTFD